MRVLWFSVTPSLFNPFSNSHNGGGWIASLEQIVRKSDVIDLGIAFYFGNDYNVYHNDGVKYYTLPNDHRSLIQRLVASDDTNARVDRYLKIVDDFKPDIIHVFGSENDFGLICDKTDIPVVIHMQGSLPPYHNALFPIGMNKLDFLSGRGLTWRRRLIGWRSESSFRRKAERETKILKNCRFFMGRTAWDKNIVKLFNPSAMYYHCEEALRDSFINGDKVWKYRERTKMLIVSVISNPWYKGVDLILKTAKLLKVDVGLQFEWAVYGVSDIRFFENKYGVKAHDVNVDIKGSVGKETLVDALCDASCYVHTSYIDNSPNSLCEAQYLGVPVLATYVGGIPSLVEDGHTGILFPANDPYSLAGHLQVIHNNRQFSENLGNAARRIAIDRHNPDSIGASLLNIYKSVLEQCH